MVAVEIDSGLRDHKDSGNALTYLESGGCGLCRGPVRVWCEVDQRQRLRGISSRPAVVGHVRQSGGE